MYWKLFKLSSYFYKVAANLEEIIQSMNLSQDIIEFLNSIPDNKKGYYIGFLKKNPNASLDDLQNVEIQKDQEPDLYEFEINLIISSVPERAKEWVKIWLKKLRRGMPISRKGQNIIKDFIISRGYDNIWQAEQVLKLTRIGKSSKFEITPTLALYLLFASKVRGIEFEDWVKNVSPNLASYTPEQAFEAVKEWHEEMAVQGAGKKYKEGSENIVYGPQWENNVWNGWTIRKIKTDNDLQVEGNLMNHCVGSYCEIVSLGESDIYSLRDPSNNPHITMEADGKTYKFIQIMGKSNSEPKQEYKEMIKEWFQKLKSEGKKVYTSSIYSDVDSWSEDWTKAKRQIVAIEDGGSEYGVEISYINENRAGDFYYIFYELSKNNDTLEPAEKLAEILHKKDKNILEYLYLRDNFEISSQDRELWKKYSGISYVSKTFASYADKFDKILENNHDNNPAVNITEPDPSDYDDEKEYQYDLKIFEKRRNELEKEFIRELREQMPFSFQDALFEHMKAYQEADPIPDYDWMGEYKWSSLLR